MILLRRRARLGRWRLGGVLADLNAENVRAGRARRGPGRGRWRTETPAPGWTIATQIAHLAWTDDIAALAATDADAFGPALQEALPQFDGYVDRAAAEWSLQPTPELLAAWRTGRQS